MESSTIQQASFKERAGGTIGTMQKPLRVLRLCSVFEPPASAVRGKGAKFDPIGGMQNHTGELTRALDRQGVVQTVVTTRPPTASWLECFGQHARVIRLGLPVPYVRQFYGLQAAGLTPALAKDADLIHAHLGEDLAVLPIAQPVARLHQIPLVVTVHCSMRHTLVVTDLRSQLLKTLGGRIEQWGTQRADAVIALTPRLARLLRADGIDEERLHVIPSGVNPDLFAGPFDDPFPDIPRPRVVFVGRLTAPKGVRTLVQAAALLRTPGVHILLVGDGPDRGALKALCQRLKLEERVHFTGFVPHDVVPAILAHVDLLVLPSLYEELGSVLLEGMQAGLPIIASRTGGIPDVIQDGENGLLVEPCNAVELAQAIDRVLEDDAFATRLRAEAQARAAEYNWNKLADRVLAIYQQVTTPSPE